MMHGHTQIKFKMMQSSEKVSRWGLCVSVLISLLSLGETNQNNNLQQRGVCGLDQPWQSTFRQVPVESRGTEP
jgi:hypothetical protein